MNSALRAYREAIKIFVDLTRRVFRLHAPLLGTPSNDMVDHRRTNGDIVPLNEWAISLGKHRSSWEHRDDLTPTRYSDHRLIDREKAIESKSFSRLGDRPTKPMQSIAVNKCGVFLFYDAKDPAKCTNTVNGHRSSASVGRGTHNVVKDGLLFVESSIELRTRIETNFPHEGDSRQDLSEKYHISVRRANDLRMQSETNTYKRSVTCAFDVSCIRARCRRHS
jgi:hypothetical protein